MFLKVFLTILVSTVACFSLSFAEVFTLNDCIKKAVDVSPEIGEAKYDVDVYRAKKEQADGYQYPQIEVLAVTGPSTRAKKTDLYPTVNTDVTTKIDGIFGRVDLSVIQPLYTFGKITAFRDAANSGIKVAEAGVEKKKSEVILKVKELYFSLAMAKESRLLVLEIKDNLERAKKTAQKHIDKQTKWADETNIYKMNAFIGEADRHLNEIEKNINVAKDALATLMGLSKNKDFDIADNLIARQDIQPENIDALQAYSSLYRAEFTQLKEGIKAKEKLVEAEKANYYPTIFAGIQGSLAGATNRDNIKNPYFYDPMGTSYGTVVLGLKWGLDFGITSGKIKEAEAELKKIKEKSRYANEAIPFQVRKAYNDYQEASKSVTATEEASKNAKKWLVTVIENYDIGLATSRDVSEAALAYATTHAGFIKSKYNTRVSYANIKNSIGMDVQEMR